MPEYCNLCEPSPLLQPVRALATPTARSCMVLHATARHCMSLHAPACSCSVTVSYSSCVSYSSAGPTPDLRVGPALAPFDGAAATHFADAAEGRGEVDGAKAAKSNLPHLRQ